MIKMELKKIYCNLDKLLMYFFFFSVASTVVDLWSTEVTTVVAGDDADNIALTEQTTKSWSKVFLLIIRKKNFFLCILQSSVFSFFLKFIFIKCSLFFFIFICSPIFIAIVLVLFHLNFVSCYDTITVTVIIATITTTTTN